MSIPSVFRSQSELMRAVIDLHFPQGFDVDASFGSGCMYQGVELPAARYDIDPQRSDVIEADSRNLPILGGSVSSVAFDPPFLTYIRAGRSGNGKMVMARRFGGYWTYGELEDHYRESLSEFWRILRPGGRVLFKCQDIVHNHRLYLTHANLVSWAEIEGYRLRDCFLLWSDKRMPAPNRVGRQKHARIHHCFFLVFEKPRRARRAGL